MGPLSIEQVLAAEAAAIHGTGDAALKPIIANLARLADDLAARQKDGTRRAKKDADERDGRNEARDDVEKRKIFYRELGKLRSAALCLSGGGIRSATFCLGIIQALAKYDLTPPPPDKDAVAPPEREVEANANDSALSRFHYLSTVSGGGYIGSWLSAWRTRNSFPTVWRNLSTRPDGADIEPPEISWLRAYSNYLTPQTGLLSADTWTAVALYMRNLLLNWLVIIPAVAVVLLVLKLIITVSVGVARIDDVWWPHLVTEILGVACLVVAQAYTTRHRPTRRPPTPPWSDHRPEDRDNISEWAFLRNDLLWSFLSALLITSSFTSAVGVDLAASATTPAAIFIGAGIGVLIFAIGWLAGWAYKARCADFLRWSLSGLIYGGLIGLGAHLYSLMAPYSPPPNVWNILVPVIFGVPWVLLSQLFADMVFVGLTSYQKKSDEDREWLGRAAGWVAALAVGWVLMTLITVYGGYFLTKTAEPWIANAIAAAGGISGIVMAWLGKSGAATKAKADDKKNESIFSKVGIALAGPLFAAILVVGISIALDRLLFGGSLLEGLTFSMWSTCFILTWIGIGLLATVFVAGVASRNVNINRFSIHALYRNRLMRAYLGASRQDRYPDRFTGFDEEDNLRAMELWPPLADHKMPGHNTYCLFHVVNITLNVVNTARLAWQQRKAEPFTVTALHSGSAYKGYRASSEYGGSRDPLRVKPEPKTQPDTPPRANPRPTGISLGTAMAISGAAANPNMGYNSSPSITLLLSLFNVRLGWWLGNPGKEGEQTYREEGPLTAIRPLAEETFGLTTDTNPWVNLSDGGHFENLGIYEMVRRRCRFILVVDAGCDPKFEYEDLGNAVRKTYIDLGVRIEFPELGALKNRPKAKELEEAIRRCEALHQEVKPSSPIPYYAIGTVDYRSADGKDCDNGVILYIKPAYHGTSRVEGAGVRNYAMANETFPHEPTGDQWFSESQFESYRTLALDIAGTFMNNDKIIQPKESGPAISLREMLAGLSPTARS